MKFLQAHSLLKGFSSEKKQKLALVMSGQPENLSVFIRAEYARKNIECVLTTIPFNTLQQYLMSARRSDIHECIVLFPWDFLPALDWRSGISKVTLSAADIHQQISTMMSLLEQRSAAIFYVPAPCLPIAPSAVENQRWEKLLLASALQAGATLLKAEYFSLASYLNFGAPISNQCSGELAEVAMPVLLPGNDMPKKILVTDLDNVMWAGVIGEDGVEGIRDSAEGAGFVHFLYQTYLRKLKQEGVLLAAVSKNDADLAVAPFKRPGSLLKEEDFVAILASYNDKHSQIAELIKRLNIGADACVFVDDNSVEIAAVEQEIPSVTCLTFPAKVDDHVTFYEHLNKLFSNPQLTDEDKRRTELYRARLKGIAPVMTENVNLDRFLADLNMQLRIFDRTVEQQSRALQLINKTNQFNLNGVRYSADELEQVLSNGGQLFTATLMDKHGDHGEIIACLLDGERRVRSWVMSCRVMQRKVEYAFLSWLARHRLGNEIVLHADKTDRNTPIQQFIAQENFTGSEVTPNRYVLSSQLFLTRHQGIDALFNIMF